MKTYKEVAIALSKHNPRSKWDKGVKKIAEKILRNVDAADPQNAEKEFSKKECLMGAEDYKRYVNSGFALYRNHEILHTLCSTSEIKRMTSVKTKEMKDSVLDKLWEANLKATYQAFDLLKCLANK